MKIYQLFADYLEKSDKARNEAELFRVFMKALRRHGFDLASFDLLTDHKSLRLKRRAGVFGNFPERWMRYYNRYNLHEIDPIISYAEHKMGTFTWKEIPDHFSLSAKQKKFLKATAKAGIHNGRFTPLRGPGNQFAGMAVATSRKGAAPHIGADLLTAYCNQFYIVWRRFHQAAVPHIKQPSLTMKEKEILSLVARGKTDPETSYILGISRHTVNMHLRNIFRKLETNNRVHATSKALLMGIIRM